MQLILMKLGGQIIYSGMIGHHSRKLIEYFEVCFKSMRLNNLASVHHSMRLKSLFIRTCAVRKLMAAWIRIDPSATAYLQEVIKTKVDYFSSETEKEQILLLNSWLLIANHAEKNPKVTSTVYVISFH